MESVIFFKLEYDRKTEISYIYIAVITQNSFGFQIME